MRVLLFNIIYIIVIMGVARAQSVDNNNNFGSEDSENKYKGNEQFYLNHSNIILEEPIDSISYIIGPGDVFGININTMDKMFFSASVGPVGDLLIPGVGSVSISGVNLKNSFKMIKDRIAKTYKNAVIDVSLIDLKYFRVQIYGGVNKPGFFTIRAAYRLITVIEFAEGLHKYADEENIIIISENGDKTKISLKAFLNDGNLINNPQIREGDKIEVPILESYIDQFKNDQTFKDYPVWVTGFVNTPGPIKFFPGYSVKDYIGSSGGVSELGSIEKAYLLRDGAKLNISNYDKVKPGDHIIIPEEKFGVIVTGFVNTPGPIKFFPGYSVKDYIGLAGGVAPQGNFEKVFLIRDDIKSKVKNDVIMIPGDHLIVPRGAFSVFFGDNSLLQTLSSLFSIISTYIILSASVNN